MVSFAFVSELHFRECSSSCSTFTPDRIRCGCKRDFHDTTLNWSSRFNIGLPSVDVAQHQNGTPNIPTRVVSVSFTSPTILLSEYGMLVTANHVAQHHYHQQQQKNNSTTTSCSLANSNTAQTSWLSCQRPLFVVLRKSQDCVCVT